MKVGLGFSRDKLRRESSKRNYYIIFSRVIIKAIIIIARRLCSVNEAIDLDLLILGARWDRLLRSSSAVNVGRAPRNVLHKQDFYRHPRIRHCDNYCHHHKKKWRFRRRQYGWNLDDGRKSRSVVKMSKGLQEIIVKIHRIRIFWVRRTAMPIWSTPPLLLAKDPVLADGACFSGNNSWMKSIVSFATTMRR